jgi:hypothetical protein
MNDDDAQAYFRVLEQILREQTLTWILDECQEALAVGKSVRRVVSSSAVSTERGSRRSRRGEEFVRTEAFTPVERLALLVDAIERTVTSTSEMEERALKNLKVDEIVFDNGSRSNPTISASNDRVRISRPASDLLRATLHRLRAEIDAD